MANDREQSRTYPSRTNPSVDPKTGNVNPSAPTTGTEGWGNTSDERRTLSDTEPSATLSEQTRGDKDGNQADRSRRTGTAGGDSQTSTFFNNTTHEGKDRTFRCADAGSADCQWETSGSTDDEVMEQAEQHARTAHGWNDWTEAMRRKVRDAIRERRAA